MELQFESTVCQCLKWVAWEVQEQEQTLEVKIEEAMPDIGRVIACWGQSVLRSKQWRGGSMSAAGGVMTWTLYMPEDGTQPRCVEAWVPFQLKWDLQDSQREGTMAVSCLLRSADARTVSPRKLMVRVCVSALGEAMEPSQAAIYRPSGVPADVELLRRVYPLEIPTEAGEKMFLLDEEAELPGMDQDAGGLIRYDLRPELQEQKLIADRLVIRGVCKMGVLYTTGEGKLRHEELEFPFSQYAELDRDHAQESTAHVTMAVTSLEPEWEEEGKLRIKAGLVAQYVIFDRMMTEVVEDAYSPLRPVALRQEQLSIPAVLDRRRETVTAEKNLSGVQGQIVETCALPQYPKRHKNADETVLDLPGMFSVLYYDQEGDLQSEWGAWEESLDLPAHPDTAVHSTLAGASQPQTVMSPEGAQARTTMAFDLRTVSFEGIPMVTGLEVGEPVQPDPNRPSLILRRAGNRSLWEIAKDCGSTVEAIRDANKLQAEPDAGQMLLIPVL